MTQPKDDTFPKLLLRNRRRFGAGRIAYREKDMGIWKSKTWEDLYNNVERLSLGLMELGLNRGDAVAFIGDNRPEYLWGILAVQALGASTTGIYQDSLPQEVEYILNHVDAKFVIVEDQEQTDKILDIKDRLPKLQKVIVDDLKGLKNYNEALLIRLNELQTVGDKVKAKNPDCFEKVLSQGLGDDTALISYTSGTTGKPKGAVLSYNNLLRMAASLEAVIPMDENDRVITYLPLAWIAEIVFSICFYLRNGFTIHFPESVETVQENLREVGPTLILAAPRIWEKMCSDVQVKVMDSSWLKRNAYRICSKIGYRSLDIISKRGRMRIFDRFAYSLAYFLIYRSLQDRLGLSHIKHAFTGGAALGPDIFRFYQAFGVNIKQMYGQTEMGGFICTHKEGDVNYLTVGRPIPDVEIKISYDGEILCKGPGLFLGYHKNPEATRNAIDESGYFHTGDFGYFREEDGHLVVIDRMKDVMKLSDGSSFSPTFIENRLKFSPYIREAIAIGKDRPYAVALIQIDYAYVGAWAEKRQISYTTFTDLAHKTEVDDLIANEVEKVNKNLPEGARIVKFLLLDKELDADDEELTRTQKIRRGFIFKKYKALISSIYEEIDR